MTFKLPEEDQAYLDENQIAHKLMSEPQPGGPNRRGVLLPAFRFQGAHLLQASETGLVECDKCDLLIIVPAGYSTTKLDSFYTSPHLKRPDQSDPQNANGRADLFGRSWQFWSRHLEDAAWRIGVDGLRTFLSYIRGELRRA